MSIGKESGNYKFLIAKIETGDADIKKKMEMEANETRYNRWFMRFPNLKVDLYTHRLNMLCFQEFSENPELPSVYYVGF